MNQPERRVDFDALNLLGKAVYAGGTAVRVLAEVIDTVIERAAIVVADAEKAFKQGLDPNIEDAKILQETARDKKQAPGPSTKSPEGDGPVNKAASERSRTS